MRKIKSILVISSVFIFTCSFAFGQLDFTSGSQFDSDLSFDTLRDSRDGIVYKTIKIGSQIWMAENLRYKMPGSYAFDNDNTIAEKYGRLYDWNTAINACPCGWHLPANSEWDQLVGFLGGENNAGSKLKSAAGWGNTTGLIINNSGFSALGAGYRHEDGTFGSLGANANFWSSTLVENELVWGRNLFYKNSKVNLRKYFSLNFYSVRCVKDSNFTLK